MHGAQGTHALDALHLTLLLQLLLLKPPLLLQPLLLNLHSCKRRAGNVLARCEGKLNTHTKKRGGVEG